MEIHLKIVGSLLIGLSLMHIFVPKYFQWEKELVSVSLITKQILYVHTFFIALIVLLIGLLCLNYSHELVYSAFGRVISLGLFGFWLTRLIFQFLVYSPKVWKGKKFETVMHFVFSLLWLYFTGVFLFGYLESGTISIYGEAQFNHSRSYYGKSYDSTQGVPSYVFIGFWIIIILFLLRLGWEFRDEIFKKKE
jgi:hypothetical protein